MANEYYEWYKAHGICVGCYREKAAKGKTRCLVCLSIDADKSYNKRHAMTDEQRAEVYRKGNEAKKRLFEKRRAEGLCPYCNKRKIKQGQKQCDWCRARKRQYQERYRRAHGQLDKQYMREDKTICTTCGQPVKAGFKVCESCYQHCADMGQTGRAKRKAHFWDKDNRIVFLR